MYRISEMKLLVVIGTAAFIGVLAGMTLAAAIDIGRLSWSMLLW